jgi:ribonuclease BN (tRNA processing enzyme)
VARVYILGAGTPTPTPTRFGTSYVAQFGNEYFMFDCGPAATAKLARLGISPTQVDYLYFTHHHFDHDVDYPCFLLCRWDQSIGRENQLQVFGPQPTATFTDRILNVEYGAFNHDWLARINSPASQQVHVNRGGTLPRQPPSVQVTDIGPGPVNTGRDWRVTAGLAEHVQPYLDSLAYRLDTSEGSIVFTGDTHPCQSVIDLARDADMMICMCAQHEDLGKLTKAFVGACGTKGAAQMARDANVKQLVLAHVGPELAMPGEKEKGLGDIARIYNGRVIFADELMVLDV